MLHQAAETFASTHPASHWTGPIKVRFLDCLAHRGNVRLAARQVGLSAETAYRQRRRDPVFARAWAAAIALARPESEQILADRAIDGIEEAVWYRGEMVGTRRRFDTRLLLAHLARLDKLVTSGADADAARFDELLAVIAEEDPAGLADPDAGLLPPHRTALIDEALEEAVRTVDDGWTDREDENGYLDPDQDEQYSAEIAAAQADARAIAQGRWNAWIDHAHRKVDAMLADAPPPGGEELPPEPCQQRQHPAVAVTLPADPGDDREAPPDC